MPLVLYCRIHRFFFSSVWVSGGGGDVVGRGVVGGGVCSKDLSRWVCFYVVLRFLVQNILLGATGGILSILLKLPKVVCC